MGIGFLVPAFLAGLAALAIPLLMHLRHRDKDRPFRFPSLMFLEQLPIRTSQRQRITDWPLLLLRALAVAALVFAFARPVLTDRAAAGGQIGIAEILAGTAGDDEHGRLLGQSGWGRSESLVIE